MKVRTINLILLSLLNHYELLYSIIIIVLFVGSKQDVRVRIRNGRMVRDGE